MTHAINRARASSSSEEERTPTKATKRSRESFSALEPSSSEEQEEEDPSEGEKEDERSSKRRRRDEPSAEQDVPALLAELVKNQQQTSRDQRRFALQQNTANKVLIASVTAMTALLQRSAPSSAQKFPSVRDTRYLFNIFVYINPLIFS